MRHIGIDEGNRPYYVSDYSKQNIFSYDSDSALTDYRYK